MTFQSIIGFLPNLGMPEIIIILGLGLLIFGRRLPQVGRSVGRSIVEFKKGLKGIEEDIDDAIDNEANKVDHPQNKNLNYQDTSVLDKQSKPEEQQASI